MKGLWLFILYIIGDFDIIIFIMKSKSAGTADGENREV